MRTLLALALTLLSGRALAAAPMAAPQVQGSVRGWNTAVANVIQSAQAQTARLDSEGLRNLTSPGADLTHPHLFDSDPQKALRLYEHLESQVIGGLSFFMRSDIPAKTRLELLNDASNAVANESAWRLTVAWGHLGAARDYAQLNAAERELKEIQRYDSAFLSKAERAQVLEGLAQIDARRGALDAYESAIGEIIRDGKIADADMVRKVEGGWQLADESPLVTHPSLAAAVSARLGAVRLAPAGPWGVDHLTALRRGLDAAKVGSEGESLSAALRSAERQITRERVLPDYDVQSYSLFERPGRAPHSRAMFDNLYAYYHKILSSPSLSPVLAARALKTMVEGSETVKLPAWDRLLKLARARDKHDFTAAVTYLGGGIVATLILFGAGAALWIGGAKLIGALLGMGSVGVGSAIWLGFRRELLAQVRPASFYKVAERISFFRTRGSRP